MKVFKKLIVLLVCTMGLTPGMAAAWWNDAWSYRVAISLDTTAVGAGIDSTLMDVPVLVKLHTGNFQDFFILKEDLADLRFIGGDDKTPLKFHVESFDLINQLMYVWVKLPQLTGALNTEKIWMYYGNEQAVAGGDAAGTYDVNMGMVHHFQSANNLLNDETAYGNRFVTSAGTLEAAALIGSGMRFTGEGGVSLPASTSTRLVPSNGLTVSFWVKPEDNSSSVLFTHSDGNNEIKVMNNADQLTARLVSSSSGEAVTQPVGGFTPGQWHQITVAISVSKLTLYINGIEGSAVDAPVPEIGGQIIFGADINGNFPFKGAMDEIEYSNIVRTTDYILLSARNQGIDNRLLRIGEAEQLGNAGSSDSHFAFVMKKLTFDAKVVIVVLLVMSIISWIVMLMKGLYLARIGKDNKAFLMAYYALGTGDPALLDSADNEEDKALADSPIAQALFGSHDHFQASTIYHMYHRGINEVKLRVGASVGARASSMSEQSADAIRAAMDADMVRELQKVNARMVLLTIAISGGPFIGLLGTVIGVMITFAEMAATGDVNIASIAPGMAAALMATVAGLWVAIPALFGYNYLGARIGEITADMRVFIDEFVTRVAEYYGE
jgi:biopolymer transport protein ExbB